MLEKPSDDEIPKPRVWSDQACCQLLLASFVGEHRSLQPERIEAILACKVVTDIVLGTHKWWRKTTKGKKEEKPFGNGAKCEQSNTTLDYKDKEAKSPTPTGSLLHVLLTCIPLATGTQAHMPPPPASERHNRLLNRLTDAWLPHHIHPHPSPKCFH